MRFQQLINRTIRYVVLLGPHELVALALFLATVAVWAVTLEAIYR